MIRMTEFTSCGLIYVAAKIIQFLVGELRGNWFEVISLAWGVSLLRELRSSA